MIDGHTDHLDEFAAASYLDGSLSDAARRRVQGHLARCESCRFEIAEAGDIARTLPSPARTRRMTRVGLAAAAIILLLAFPRSMRDTTDAPVHREPPVAPTIPPRGVSPAGAVTSASAVTWTSVPLADRYSLRVFDSEGSVLWEAETADTSIAWPDSARLRPGSAYFWRVEAHTGFQRRAASDLIEFSIARPPLR